MLYLVGSLLDVYANSFLNKILIAKMTKMSSYKITSLFMDMDMLPPQKKGKRKTTP